ncbi:group II intron maturase-specific domain-containing protein [Bradyrhizobium sp. B120]|uniref:group II intron maturase-specific domain-containing protein n=1 Tax=Bradyrhizobium sp. B120 TaxID=3410088 RepID=UPI003B9809E4
MQIRLNRLLRGWSAYFSYGGLASSYQTIDDHVYDRVCATSYAIYINAGARHKTVSSRGCQRGIGGAAPPSRARNVAAYLMMKSIGKPDAATGLMSGEGKRGDAARPKQPRLSTLLGPYHRAPASSSPSLSCGSRPACWSRKPEHPPESCLPNRPDVPSKVRDRSPADPRVTMERPITTLRASQKIQRPSLPAGADRLLAFNGGSRVRQRFEPLRRQSVARVDQGTAGALARSDAGRGLVPTFLGS